MKNTLFFVTGNKNKFAEASIFIPGIQQLAIDLIEVQEIDPHQIIASKLQEARKQQKAGMILVEDTSLYLEGMNGLPGPLIKWFLKTIGTKGLASIAEKFGNANAVAKVIVGLSEDESEPIFFEGSIEGSIVQPRGTDGFGWDFIFQPNGFSHTFAEMGPAEKSKISMRKIAFEKLRTYLEKKTKSL